MRQMRRLLIAVFALVISASTAGAYYHFYHYTNRSAPFNPVPEKFDLSVLPNKTVTFFISDTASGLISQSNLFPSALAAIRQAASTWNSVDSSDIRVAFGGIASSGTPQNTPGADIVFDEMDPFTLGLTSTNAAKNSFAFGPNGSFVPIQRPQVRLNRNLSNWTSPSFTEAFFLTVAHEMGHALGLQHTFTASLMSTEVTRATSLYSPLTPDDIAGISDLYPKGTLSQGTGSIAGRITFPNGQGVHLASVVAIRPTGAAVSAFTDPDGRFRIDGVPANQYFLYVHPAPPSSRAGAAPGDLWLPVGPDGQSVAADGPFQTMFYGLQGPTRDYTQAVFLNVISGGLIDGINLTLNRTNAYAIPAVTTYSFFNQTAVRPGYLNGGGTLVASGSGLTSNGAPAPGLTVNFLGGTPVLASGGIRAYNGSFLALDLQATSTFGGNGPRHVLFSLPNDIYILPDGLNLVQGPPPNIASVTPTIESNGSRSLALAGSMLNSDTRFFLDGVPASVLRFDDSGRAVISLPPGLAGLRPIVSAFNPDGQNSMFLTSGSPVTYTYDTGDPGVATLSPNSVQAGTESMVEITGSNSNFVDGLTMVGFGSSDVQVRRVWIVAPNKIWANVWVAPNAAVTSSLATVLTGFQLISQPFAFQIQGPNGRSPVLSSQVVNAAPNQTGIYPGAAVILSGSNLSNPNLTVGGLPATIIASNSNQITFQVPLGLPAGPAILKFTNGVDTAAVVIPVSAAPPDVVSVTGSDSTSISSNRPAVVGDMLRVQVTSLSDSNLTPDLKRVRVNVAGVEHQPLSITPQGVGHQVQFVLSPAVGSGQVPLTVSTDTRTSLPYYIQVQSK